LNKKNMQLLYGPDKNIRIKIAVRLI